MTEMLQKDQIDIENSVKDYVGIRLVVQSQQFRTCILIMVQPETSIMLVNKTDIFQT